MTRTENLHHIATNTLTCMCGDMMLQKVGTATSMIRGKEIKIHQAPYYECCSCGEIEFDVADRISSMVVDTFQKGESNVTWTSPNV